MKGDSELGPWLMNPNKEEEHQKKYSQNPQGSSPSRPYPRRWNWKHKSSHPLENLNSPLESGIRTKAQDMNFMDSSSFLS